MRQFLRTNPFIYINIPEYILVFINIYPVGSVSLENSNRGTLFTILLNPKQIYNLFRILMACKAPNPDGVGVWFLLMSAIRKVSLVTSENFNLKHQGFWIISNLFIFQNTTEVATPGRPVWSQPQIVHSSLLNPPLCPIILSISYFGLHGPDN